MKNKPTIIFCLIFFIGTLGFTLYKAYTKGSSSTNKGSINLQQSIQTTLKAVYLVGVESKTIQDISALSKLGYQFNVPAHKAVISSDAAVKNAAVTYPGLKGNTNYTIEYQVLTLPGFNAFSQEALQKNSVLNTKKAIDHLPVYIISYKDMLIPVHSSIGINSPTQDSSSPKGYRKGEYNIVVDSTSGVPLLAFSYR